MGSKPAPLLVLARYGRLQKSQEQKTKTKKKNQLHRFLYKTEVARDRQFGITLAGLFAIVAIGCLLLAAVLVFAFTRLIH